MPETAVRAEAVATPVSRDPLWFKDAVIYQLHVRAFYDSDEDGVGDFRGLTEKLDYIQELGVTAIWLLPFFPSPLRDDGYDTSDYKSVNPAYGRLEDFKRFLKEARRRGLRVITEMVLNHTSDAHEWFQKSRRARSGEKWRDFYVWSDDPHRYRDARVIFQDFEASNWTWDPVAEAYFWHRFYSHQPDLNFDNPEVHKAMLDAVDFWLEMGIDGLRLDAVPYLYEREGTNCENLPETHEFLKRLRRHIDLKFADKMLLAEANQWPEDAATYFGDGDECHMNFHFPLMPRLFMSIEREDRFPIIDILEQTPTLPENCQWAIFLRNHDELTLEMVTDEERDYMYRAFADDPQARVNLGIRRRLAPLLKNNRRKMELMNGLLLSLGGTPVIYYGDEIGMGDNIYLGDRHGVRTPMQWNADRNAGFSRANPQRLYLPLIIDAEYHYSTCNVEVEQNSPHSFLWWTRRIINLRKQYKAFGRGTLEFLTPENPKVLAFIRRYQNEVLLIVANLSRFAQCAELDLSEFRGMFPREMFGHTRFPPIGELPYFLTIGSHAFYWFSLEWEDREAVDRAARPLPVVQVQHNWDELFVTNPLAALEKALPEFLSRNRWFAGKARVVQQVKLVDRFTIHGGLDAAPQRLLIIRVDYVEGAPEHYQVPVVFAGGRQAADIQGDHPGAGIVEVRRADGSTATLCDATWEPSFWKPLLEAIAGHKILHGSVGDVHGVRTSVFRKLRGESDNPVEPTVHGGQQSNTSVTFGDKFILKLFRRLNDRRNPDWEISLFLTESRAQANIPKVAGALEYKRRDQKTTGEATTLAVLHEFVPSEGNSWVYALDELSRYFERMKAESMTSEVQELTLPQLPLLDLSDQPPSETAQSLIGPWLQSAELLGRRTAEMHLALASDESHPAFTPEGFSKLYQRSLYQSMRTLARRNFDLLRKQVHTLPQTVRRDADRVLDRQEEVLGNFRAVLERPLTAQRIRCHGDFHLGQVLFTGKDFVIIDFEGEPERSVGERRIKRSPIRDVAGMVRSFHYVAHAALLGEAPGISFTADDAPVVRRWMDYWYRWSAARFLSAWLQTAGRGRFVPEDRGELRTLLDAYILEKAVYELGYDVNNRPTWLRIPLQGILELVSGDW